MENLSKLSVIVPVGQGDDAWRGLIYDLESLPSRAEVILVSPHELVLPKKNNFKVVISEDSGRAQQLNFGASTAKNQFLWFLHADSRFSKETLESLSRSLDETPNALLFFDLFFLPDGPFLTRLNAGCARFRSKILGLPFGDQGFCIQKDLFKRLGEFPTHVRYGEDHLLVWKARQNGVQLRCTNGRLFTSARKYRKQGWLKTTLRHNYLTWAQAMPEWKRLRQKGVRS